jgi:putative PIN family toxin of toxin-antitoxin system
VPGLRCVFDTNVVISALLNDATTPSLALKQAEEIGTVLISETIMQELTSVLARPKFSRYVSEDTIRELIERIGSSWSVVPILYTVKARSDPDDDKFLDVAVNGAATHLITGDHALLALDPFRHTHILTPAKFLLDVPRD